MPTMPKIQPALKTDGKDVFNYLRSNVLGSDFRAVIPAGTPANAREIGAALQQFEWAKNAFLGALVNRIGLVLISSKLFENPWAFFKKGKLEYGETVEEIFVNICRVQDFDPEIAVTEVFKREIPDVRAAFHQMNYQKFYKQTVTDDQLRQAFLSWQGVTDLIAKIVDSMYFGANYDEFVTMKYMLAKLALSGEIYPMNIPATTKDNAADITTTVKATAGQLTFPTTKYNRSGVLTFSEYKDQFLIMTVDYQALMDVNVLATAFNMDKVEFMGHVITVDSFANMDTERLNMLFGNEAWYTPFTQEEISRLQSIPMVAVDRDFFMIFDNLYTMTENYNGQGLYWNYFYHVWKTFSSSPFANAVLYTTETPGVTSVTVSPATVTLAKGASQNFTATVVTTGFAPRSVVWSIPEGTLSTISPDGVLKVDANETATSIVVTATSTFDGTKTGTSTVTVTA